jgi:hypothetical protein
VAHADGRLSDTRGTQVCFQRIPGAQHVIELVLRNFGRTAAHDVRVSFPDPPTVAEYENAAVRKTRDRWRSRQLDQPTDVSPGRGDARDELGRHRGQHV